MDIYNYSPITREYISTRAARPDPLADGRYLIPANATSVAPPVTNTFEVAVFYGDAWDVHEDHRSRPAWSTTDASPLVITTIGPLPEGITLEDPGNYLYPVWVDGNWQSSRTMLIQSLLEQIDTRTEQLIETGWHYPDANGQQVRLSRDDQLNFEGEKNLYTELQLDGVDVSPFFPLAIKVWTGENGEPIMLSINDLDAYKIFVRAGKAHKKAKLEEGYMLKMSLSAMGLDELTAWEDPR